MCRYREPAVRLSRPGAMLIHLHGSGKASPAASASELVEPASPWIGRSWLETSMAVEPRLHQGRQIRDMRQIGRPLGVAIEQEPREAGTDRAPDVILHVVAHAEDPL